MAAFFFAASATPAWANSFSIVNNDALAFGAIVAGSGGTVTIGASSGARAASGGVTLMNSPYREARFTVSCVADGGADTCTSTSYYSIDPVADISLTSGAQSMSVKNFSVYSVNTATSSGQLSGGTDNLKVGATLTVGNNQAPGSYAGSFSVTVVYE
jgi:hypothetical protein